MTAVNTNETYRLVDAQLTIDVAGSPYELDIAAIELGIVVTNNYADHARTGGGPPKRRIIDYTSTFVLRYAHAFGTDGILTVFDALAGTEVDWLLETADGTVSADFPTFAFTADVPWLSPLPRTAWGEYADTPDIEIPIIGNYTKATA